MPQSSNRTQQTNNISVVDQTLISFHKNSHFICLGTNSVHFYLKDPDIESVINQMGTLNYPEGIDVPYSDVITALSNCKSMLSTYILSVAILHAHLYQCFLVKMNSLH